MAEFWPEDFDDAYAYSEFEYGPYPLNPDWAFYSPGYLMGPHPAGYSGNWGPGAWGYRPRPFPAIGSGVKRKAPLPARQPAPKIRAENNEKSFVMPENAPDNFKEIVNTKRCSLCKASINSIINAEMHYNGRMHQRQLRVNNLPHGEFFSGIMRFDALPQLADDTNDSKELPPGSSKPDTLPDLPDGLDLRFCRLCNVTFTNALQSHQHYAGKKHRSNAQNQQKVKMAQAAPLTVYFCDLCQVTTNSKDALDSHFAGQKHKHNLKQKERLQKQQPVAANPRNNQTQPPKNTPSNPVNKDDAPNQSTNAISNFLSDMRSASTSKPKTDTAVPQNAESK